MREILFRGKRLDNGEWVHGDLIKNSIIDCFTYISKGIGYKVDDKEIGKPIKVFPSTVGQFTGLTDKNGKKIFEGDIIELINADQEAVRVVCEYGTARRQIFENTVDINGFYFILPSGLKSFPIVKNYAGKHDLELFEVIGNIHDKENT